jgi:hypothetical protein
MYFTFHNWEKFNIIFKQISFWGQTISVVENYSIFLQIFNLQSSVQKRQLQC